ncbi:MAG TPA: peptide ABC transporter substrate-binding protein [Steroidobacteraceae bacterium]|nr:peptide ABC transporter substrate-binding protein [Steroidobacteraceae bacterium]
MRMPTRAIDPRDRPHVMLAVLCAAMLASLVGPPAADAQTLRRGAFGEPESLVPGRSGVASETPILLDLFEGLTTFDAAGKPVPGAAQSWQVSPDGKRYQFVLRDGLKWSDGTPLHADAFVYAWRRALTPATASPRATKLYVLRGARAIHAGTAAPDTLGVSAVDARTLLVALEHPAPWLTEMLAREELAPLPRHMIEKHGDRWSRAGNHVGNGAFRLVERRVRGAIRLERNPHFHAAQSVALAEVVYLPSDDTTSLVNRFRAGELDVNGWPGFPSQRQTELQRTIGQVVHVSPLASVRYLRFNTTRPPFDDPNVRRALSLAIDRTALAQRVMRGGEQPAFRVVPADLPNDSPPEVNVLTAGTQTERTERARQTLRETRALERLGRPLRLKHPAGNGEDLCIAVAAMWTAAGMPTQLDRSEIKSMIADLRQGDFDVALTGAQDIRAVEIYLGRFETTSAYNTGSYTSDAFEGALRAALQKSDVIQRSRALAVAETILLNDHPTAPLIQEVARNLVSTRVTGWLDNTADIHLSRYLILR